MPEQTYSMVENFDDGVLNDEPWTYRYDVTEQNGYLLLRQSTTDQRSRAYFDFEDPVYDATVSFEAFYHAAQSPYSSWPGYYFLADSGFRLIDFQGETINIALIMMRSDYGPNYGNDPDNYDLPKINITFPDGDEVPQYSSGSNTSSYLDDWTTITFTLDSTTGTIEYDLESDGTPEFSITDERLIGAALDDMRLGTYGWWTGHYTMVDNLEVTGATTLETDKNLVFFDDFNRVDNTVVGNGWDEILETQAENPDYTGSATLNINDGQLEFYFDAEGFPHPGTASYQQPFMANDLNADVGDTGFEISFTIVPGDQERVDHFIGVSDASAGQSPIGTSEHHLLPSLGIGIEIARSSHLYDNSGFRIFQLDVGPGGVYEPNVWGPEFLVAQERTSFQFLEGEEISVSFRVEADGTYSVEVSNGTATDTFTGSMAPLADTLDQVFVTSIQAGLGYTGNSTESIKIDDLAVYALDGGAPQPGSDAFFDEIGGKLVTMATLAKASYRLSAADVDDPFVNDPANAVADEAYGALVGSDNFSLLTSSGISLLSDDGYFVSSEVEVPNAAALVGQTNDALFITFRGTNDGDSSNDELPQNTSPGNGKPNGPIKGLINALERINENGGNGTGVYNAVSNNLSLDQQDWLDLLGDQGGSHFDQLQPLIDAAVDYMNDNGLNTLYVSGHSLGAGMAQALTDYLDGKPEAANIQIDVVTFANPGSGVIDTYGDNITITNFWNESDPINWTDIILATPGDDNIIHMTSSEDGVDLLTDGGHNMDAYLTSMKILGRVGIDFEEVSADGSDFDEFYLSIVDGQASFELAQNTVEFSTRSDLYLDEVIVGGLGDDSLYSWSGDDVLAGLEGSDYLHGGSGNDVFVFHVDESGFTTDTVGFFEDNQDLLDLSHIDVQYSDLAIGQENGDALIDVNGSFSIVVKNIDAALLDQDDFIFA